MGSLSIVVPVYRSALTLPDLIARLGAVLPDLAAAYEVILVDDSSPDNSWAVINDLAGQYAWVRGIRLSRNFGQHNALLCGIRAARHEITVTMDDDLQHPPEALPRLLDRLAEGYDVVYGPPQRERHGFTRDMASRVTKLMLQDAMGVETARQVSAFRAFRTQVRRAFADYQSPYVSLDVLLTWGTTRFAAVPVPHELRQQGTSGYTLRKLVRHSVNMITGFSPVPLQVASLVGFGFTVFGLIVLAYVVGRVLIEGSSVPGFPFLASLISIFSGAQLFALGIIGEYIARMYFRTMQQPVYVVRTTTERERARDREPDPPPTDAVSL